MGAPIVSEEEFRRIYLATGGSAAEMSRIIGVAERNIQSRKSRMLRDGLLAEMAPYRWAYPKQQNLDFDDGVGIVFSDPHFWPTKVATVAHRALVALCKSLKPTVIIANGDLIDGTKISRFAQAGWAKVPSIPEELGEMQLRLAEVRKAYGNAVVFRTIGNHCARFDRFLSSHAEAFDGMHGTRLADHLPDWPGSWIVRVNDTWIKHRFRGGIHAGYNNVLHAGASIVTGHLHQISAKPLRGYRGGHVWGIETGTTADCPVDAPMDGGGPFEYGEGNPSNWSSGFAVLTWHKGGLCPPEFCVVERGAAWFRGKEVRI